VVFYQTFPFFDQKTKFLLNLMFNCFIIFPIRYVFIILKLIRQRLYRKFIGV